MKKLQSYTQAFKDEAVEQVLRNNYSPREVSDRLGIPINTLYTWLSKAKSGKSTIPCRHVDVSSLHTEIAQLKKALKRAEQERKILKEAAVFFASES